MITNPKTFFEQFQNFIEESGLQIKKFKSNLSNYFTKSEAIDTFLGKIDQAESAKKADEAIKATQDASGNVITATYATKAELSNKLDASSAFTKAQADNLYLGKSAKATSASVADTATSATKATQDSEGNIITSTYATKTEVTQDLAGKANSSHTHTIANVTGLQDALNAASTQASNAIPKAGNRGALAGYSSSATGTTVNATSGDSLYASANVTVANGATGQTWTKVVKLSAGTVTLGTNWAWVGGEAPELKYPCLLVCHWNQDKGIAGIVAGVA